MENKKNYTNGFSTEQQYLEAFETFKNIVEENDTYDRGTMALYCEDGYFELYLDDFCITLWDSDTVEVYINGDKNKLVDLGIMNVAFALREAFRNGELDEYLD